MITTAVALKTKYLMNVKKILQRTHLSQEVHNVSVWCWQAVGDDAHGLVVVLSLAAVNPL